MWTFPSRIDGRLHPYLRISSCEFLILCQDGNVLYRRPPILSEATVRVPTNTSRRDETIALLAVEEGWIVQVRTRSIEFAFMTEFHAFSAADVVAMWTARAGIELHTHQPGTRSAIHRPTRNTMAQDASAGAGRVMATRFGRPAATGETDVLLVRLAMTLAGSGDGGGVASEVSRHFGSEREEWETKG